MPSWFCALFRTGAPLSLLVGHSGTTTTETIYREQIRAVIMHGSDITDRIFPRPGNQDA
jgi:hypothetical protein